MMGQPDPGGSASRRFPIVAYPAFVRFWIADAVSSLGMFVVTLAMQFLMIHHLGADQADIGIVRSAQRLPTLLFGLLSGAWIDRMGCSP